MRLALQKPPRRCATLFLTSMPIFRFRDVFDILGASPTSPFGAATRKMVEPTRWSRKWRRFSASARSSLRLLETGLGGVDASVFSLAPPSEPGSESGSDSVARRSSGRRSKRRLRGLGMVADVGMGVSSCSASALMGVGTTSSGAAGSRLGSIWSRVFLRVCACCLSLSWCSFRFRLWAASRLATSVNHHLCQEFLLVRPKTYFSATLDMVLADSSVCLAA
jgi:hypothetical protein